MTSGPHMDWLRERLAHLPTCGRPKEAAAMWKAYKIHAFWACTRVGHRPHALYFNITLHNTLPVNMLICFCREICQTLVLLAVRPNGDFCRVPFWNKPRKLWKCKQSSLFVCALMYIYLCIYVFVLFYLLNNCTFQVFIHLLLLLSTVLCLWHLCLWKQWGVHVCCLILLCACLCRWRRLTAWMEEHHMPWVKPKLSNVKYTKSIFVYNSPTLSQRVSFQKRNTWLAAPLLLSTATTWQAAVAPVALSVSQTQHVTSSLHRLMAAAVLKELTSTRMESVSQHHNALVTLERRWYAPGKSSGSMDKHGEDFIDSNTFSKRAEQSIVYYYFWGILCIY